MDNKNSDCFLCNSFTSTKIFPAEIPPLRPSSNKSEYLLYRTRYSYAIVGLGAITPGYILLIPVKHHETIYQLRGKEWDDFLTLKSIIHDHVQNFYGDAIFFEHGATSACRVPSGACVDHAHLHCVPAYGKNFEDEIPGEFSEIQLGPLEELQNLSLKTERYLYLEKNGGEKFIYQPKDPVPPQFFRRIWAKLSGKPNEFDFTLFPEYQNMLITYENFRKYSYAK